MEDLLEPDESRNLRNPPEGWGALEFRDIIYAYRKAKADTFFERILLTSEDFARYECEGEGLVARLKALHHDIQEGGTEKVWKILEEGIKSVGLVPKKLKRKPQDDPVTGRPIQNGHAFLSDPKRALARASKTDTLIPAFRTTTKVSVEFRIITALWVNWVGHRYDACLDETAYGSRVRRIKSISNEDLGAYHIDAVGSFEPYFFPYKDWRNQALKRIRRELEEDESIIVLTLDLKSFYHHIDPEFIKEFPFEHADVQAEWGSLSLAAQEIGGILTNLLSDAYAKIEKRTRSELGLTSDCPVGLPLSDPAARIMSNVLLARWDKAVQEKLTPLHYGRYVDDMLLVLRDNKKMNSATEVMAHMVKTLGDLLEVNTDATTSKPDGWTINLGLLGDGNPLQADSRLILQNGKHKVFFLSGKPGLDLLESVEKEIHDVASERRFMPDTDFLDKSPGARALTAAGNPATEPDTFGRAEGLSIRRLGWSIQMRNAETLAEDLEEKTWKEQRHIFYKFAKDHVLSPLSILDQFQSIPRLIGLAISQYDWGQAVGLMTYAKKSTDQLLVHVQDEVEINGKTITGDLTLIDKSKTELGKRLSAVLRDASIAAWPWKNKIPFALNSVRAEKFRGMIGMSVTDADWQQQVLWCAQADLAKTPYKRWHEKVGARPTESSEQLNRSAAAWKNEGFPLGVDIQDFLIQSRVKRRQIKGVSESCLPFLFPTRAYSPQEIAERIPKCVIPDGCSPQESLQLWGRMVKAVRGVWVDPLLVAPDAAEDAEENAGDPEKEKPMFLKIPLEKGESGSVKIALANLRTEDAEWAAAACGKPKLSLERYRQLATLANAVLSLPSDQKPDYLVLPELAMPRQWLESFANRLLARGISLITGVEYLHLNKNSRVANEVCLILADKRLGYATSLRIWHRKYRPAPKELDDLRSIYNKSWRGRDDCKRIYLHRGLAFGVLICSELQNIGHQSILRSNVDALIVPSWNRDNKTFSPTIEAACFGMHAYVVYANNGTYGDARIRGPLKEDYLQDICRIRGGLNPYVVVGEIDVASLRRFHTRNETTGDGLFKPVPDGFKVAKHRKLNPPK